jgi:hypothetical protein
MNDIRLGWWCLAQSPPIMTPPHTGIKRHVLHWLTHYSVFCNSVTKQTLRFYLLDQRGTPGTR